MSLFSSLMLYSLLYFEWIKKQTNFEVKIIHCTYRDIYIAFVNRIYFKEYFNEQSAVLLKVISPNFY